MRRRIASTSTLFLLASLFATAYPRTSDGGEVDELKSQGDRLYTTHYEEPGRLPLAILMYEKALEKEPGNYDTLWRLAMMCQIYGQTMPEEQKKRRIVVWEKGQEYGRRATKANPQGKEGHFYFMSNLGSIVRTKGKMASLWNVRKIKKAMDKTLELDPDFPPALVARAQFLTQMPGVFGGSKKEAMRLYQRAVTVDPRYHIAYYYIAEAHSEEGRYDEALAALDKLLNCPEEDREGSWATVDRVWAERLLLEINEKKEEQRHSMR